MLKTENKNYLNTDELKALGLEDLESVAGGFDVDKLTEEDRKRAYELDAKWKKARHDCDNRLITIDEYEAILFEYQGFLRMLVKKYDGVDA